MPGGVSYEIGYANKAVNSTSRNFSGVLSGSAYLKEPCDYHNPVLQVSGDPANYSYMKLGTSDYYWVDKVISFPNGIIEVHGHLDPLATYQEEIAATSGYAVFHSKVINTEADDPRMNPEIVASKTVINKDSIFKSTPTMSGGNVIVTTFEAGYGGTNQGVKTYAMSLADFTKMLKNLQNSLYDSAYNINQNNSDINSNLSNFTGPDDVANMIGNIGSIAIHDIIKALSDTVSKIGGYGSWRDNLIKAVYVPFTNQTVIDSKNVHLGFLDTGLQANLVDPIEIKTKTSQIQIPWNSKTIQYHFLKHSKYHQFQAVCCGGQYANIDSELIRDLGASDNLSIHTSCEICSGDWSAVLTKDSAVNSMRLASFGGNLGIEITGLAGKGGLGMGMNFTTAGFNMAASALSMGAINLGTSTSDSLLNVGSGIASRFINTNGCTAPSGIAGNGISSFYLNGSSGYNDMSLVGQLTYPAIIDGVGGADYDSYCQKFGFPCNQYVPMTLDGSFVIFSGNFVISSANQQDQAYINSVLNSGILLET